MRKWVAGVAIGLAVVLFATAAWHRFEYRYCNAQRLNLELAASGNPAQLAIYLEEDHARDAEQFRQWMLSGLLLAIGAALWTGRLDPEDLQQRARTFWAAHRPHLQPHR
jgi:hypothetical protein